MIDEIVEKLLSEELDFVISLFFATFHSAAMGLLNFVQYYKASFFIVMMIIIHHYDAHCLFSGGSGANLDRGSVSRLGREELAG